MDIKKFLIGTLVGGISVFFLGYLIYGVALMSFISQHTIAPPGTAKSMSDFSWGALILGNLALGALLTYIFLKIGTVNSFGRGVGVAASVGFFMYISEVATHYATGNFLDITGSITDVVAGIILTALAGGIIAAVLGMGKKKT
jgi:hypothetical protein